ncbi:proline-rich transmembrane protein 1-like [Patiria miniata]|uniref:Uncharacterized protein n=1 Tax=Patiria miniata TaxID=46514 RepID=A0A913ZQI2_PATMI|nr:proline-rich transmembrane protein 1-like [Patiria miniata]
MKDDPPAYSPPAQQQGDPLQRAYPLQQIYPPQLVYPTQQIYPGQQVGYPSPVAYNQVAYNRQRGAIILTASSPNVIVRSHVTKMPNNYMGLSIFVTLCCCLPFGVVAMMKASKVKARWAEGDIRGAHLSSKDAKMWSTSGLVIGVIWIIVCTFVGFYFYTVIPALSD